MATDRIREELVAFVCGELDDADRARLETALQADPEMAAEARRLAEALLAVTPSRAASVAEDFNSRLRERLQKEGLGQSSAARHLHLPRAFRLKAGLAAAAAAVVIAAGLWMLLAPGGAGGIAFADVRRQIERTQTMTVTCVAQMKGMKKPMTMKMLFKYPGLMRQEMTVEPAAFLPPDANPPGFSPSTEPAAVEVIGIFDMVNLKALSLIPSQKKAMPFEFRNLPPEATEQSKKQDLLEQLKKVVAGEHQDLGEETIEGRKARGYRCKSPEMQQVTMDIWVDASTGTPLVVEQTMPESFGGIKVTMTDFVINPELDDSLFDTTVPEGYTVESQVVDWDAKEEDLIKGVGRLAKYCDGFFPHALTPTPELLRHLIELGKSEKLSEEEAKEFGTLIQKVMMFQLKTMRGGEFVYAGEGVKLGDKATPILWYKAKDTETYRVIYGDLHAEDAQTAPQRPATQPAE